MDYLRETVIRDIVELIGDIKDGGEKLTDRYKNSKYNSSISKASKDLIMTFPVICSNTLDAKDATMVSKAIERKCVTMLQLVFASSTLGYKDVKSMIKDYHNNIDMGTLSVDQYIDLTSNLVQDGKAVKGMFEGATERDVQRVIREAMRDLNKDSIVLEESVNPRSIQDFKILERYDQTVVVSEADRDEQRKEEKHASDIRKNNVDAAATRIRAGKDLADTGRLNQEEFKRQLLDNDIKKCNELVPSLLVVGYIPDETKGETVYSVVGIKARLIGVDSFEIIDKIFVKHNDKNGLLKLIRATTKEISFVKDFLLAIEKAKIDAISNSRRGSTNRIWKTLERRAIKSNIKKALGRSNDASAITSLVMTQEEVDYLKKNYNIDMTNASTVRSVLESYNLLSFVIVDESIEVVKFFFDADDNFETLSYNSLERESGDGMYKKVINLMTKINR